MPSLNLQVICVWLLATGERAREVYMHLPEDCDAGLMMLVIVWRASKTGDLMD